MAPYTPLLQTSTPTFMPHFDEHEDLLEGLQNIPSHFDLALHRNSQPKSAYVPPNPKEDGTLLDPSHYSRRLSTSTLSSSEIHSRGTSPCSPSLSPSPPPPKTWKTTLQSVYHSNESIFLVTLSQLFGALMNVTTRLLELEGPKPLQPFQILFARQGLTMVFCTLWMWWKDVEGFPLGRKGVRGLLVVRALSGFWGIYGLYYSLQYLPVADSIVITFLAPSVAGYCCYLFLREPFPRSSQYASLVSLLGVVLIARPTSFFSSPPSAHHNTTSPTNTTTTTTSDIPSTYPSYPTPTPTQRLNAIFFALIGVLGSAGAFTSIRYIGTRAHPLLSVNYFSTFCFLISLLSLLFVPTQSDSDPQSQRHLTFSSNLPSSPRQWGMLLFLGVCGFTMQFLLTKGLGGNGRRGGARGMNMVYTNMLFAVGLDRWIFGVVPGWWSLAGSGCILGSAVWVAVGGKEGEDGRERDQRSDEERGGRGRGDVEERRGMLSASSGGDDGDEEMDRVEGNVVELREISSPRHL